jgi:hypothetical protein
VIFNINSVLLDNLKHIWKNKLQILSHSVRKTNCLSSVIKHRPVIEGDSSNNQTLLEKSSIQFFISKNIYLKIWISKKKHHGCCIVNLFFSGHYYQLITFSLSSFISLLIFLLFDLQ